MIAALALTIGNMDTKKRIVRTRQLIFSLYWFFLVLRCLLKNVWLFVHAIIMPDGPPTGGYPKIGAVASADLPLLAQCVPNQSRIRFRETTVTKAQEKYRAVFEGLQKIVPDE